MEHARRHGYPVPQVYDATETDMVMDRVAGRPMTEELLRRPWRIAGHAATLASLHQRLHEIEAPVGLAAPFGEGSSLLHMDLHPANVLLGPDGPMVIDWAAASQGPAEADVAQSWVIMASSVPDAGPVVRLLVSVMAPRFVAAFLGHFDAGRLRPLLRPVAERRGRDPNVRPVEAQRIDRLMKVQGV